MIEQASPFPAGGVIHCFSGDSGDAARTLDLGFHISIPGTATYKNNGKLRDIISQLPHDRVIIETDSPYLAPEPKRGSTNEPANLVHTAARVAGIMGLSLDESAQITSAAACKLFRIS